MGSPSGNTIRRKIQRRCYIKTPLVEVLLKAATKHWRFKMPITASELQAGDILFKHAEKKLIPKIIQWKQKEDPQEVERWSADASGWHRDPPNARGDGCGTS